MKKLIRTHLYRNNGKLFGLIKFYRISNNCKGEMRYCSNDYDSNFQCSHCNESTYSWSKYNIFGTRIHKSSIKKCI